MIEAPGTPPDSPLTMEEALASALYRDLSTSKLAPGDVAFDFELAGGAARPLRRRRRVLRRLHPGRAPRDGWVLTSNRAGGIAVHDPASGEERTDVAQACAVGLRISLPVLVDGLDDAVASAYGGWPDRLYLIGRDGRIAFQGEEGPFGFRPEELEAAIEAELAR